jgi:type VI secretion system secreted protein Hcp
MAVDMFLKITNVSGESKDKVHTNEIDISSWSWGVSNSSSAHVGGGAGAGKTYVQDLTLIKYVDCSSPKLMLACCNGTHFPAALITVRKAGGAAPVEYLKVKLEKFFITGFGTEGHWAGDRMTENVVLNFEKVSVDYTPQDDKGAPGTAIPFGWDVAANAHE